jgi:hypothetical protein
LLTNGAVYIKQIALLYFSILLHSIVEYTTTCSVEQRQLNVRPSTIKLHADGNITSKLIEQIAQPEDMAIAIPWLGK